MANIEFEDFVTGLTEETTPDNAADFLVIVDTSGSDVNKVKPSNILGADLTAIKALTPANDDVLQRKAGAWTNRTIAQLTADLAITPNATHTGEVTGSGALTVNKTAITGKTGVSAAVDDSVLLSDASDSDNLKKATIQSIINLAAEQIGIACSDETTDLTIGTAKATFRMPFAMTVTGVRANVNTAPTGSTLIVDINDGGTSILSTKLSIDASEKTSTTAAAPAVISDTALADDAEITIDIDQVGSTIAGKGLKVWITGTRT